MLSATGSLLPIGKAKSEERRNLADFSRSIDAVKKTITSFKKRANMPGLDPDAKRVYELVITTLQKEAKGLERQFAKRVKASSCRLQYDLAQSVPHIGHVAARVCVCELPEDLPEQSPAKMSSYAGIAPINHSSGAYNPAPKIARGNKRLKKALYMAAVSALRREEWAKSLYHRLIAKGKTHDQAIVPIMRKLLVRVVCVLKRGTPWQAVPLRA
jgi:transposase